MHLRHEFKGELLKLINLSSSTLDFLIKSTSRLLFIYEVSSFENLIFSEELDDKVVNNHFNGEFKVAEKLVLIDSFKDFLKAEIQQRNSPKKFSCQLNDITFFNQPSIISVERIDTLQSGNFYYLGVIHLDTSIHDIPEQTPIPRTANPDQGLSQIPEEKAYVSQFENQLNYQVAYRDLLMHIANRFINIELTKVDEMIQISLGEIGEFLGVDRVYIVRYDLEEWTASLEYEWCKSEIKSHIQSLQGIPLDHAKVFLDHHMKGKAIYIPDVSSLEDCNTKAILEIQDIKSLLGIPIIHQEKVLGFVGLDSVSTYHEYSEHEKNLLSLFADILVSLKVRESAEKELEKTQVFLEQTHSFSGICGWIFNSKEGKIEFDAVAQVILKDHYNLPTDIEGLRYFVPYQVYEVLRDTISTETLKDVKSWDDVIELKLPKMSSLWIRSKGTIIDQNGQLMLLGSFQDISNIKTDKDKLIFQSSILHHIHEAVIGVDNLGKIVYYNQAAEALFDINTVLKLGDYCFEVFPSIFGRSQANLIMQHLNEKHSWHSTIEFRRDGHPLKYLSTNVIKVEDDVNQFYGGFLTFRDVTMEKKMQDQLIESELKFRTFVESNDDLIFTTDINGIVQYMSPNLTKYSTIPVKDVLGNSFTLVLNEKQRALFHEKLLKTVHSQKSQSFEFQYQSEFDYTFKWHLATLAPLLDDDGVVYQVLGIAKDISEIKIKEVALQTSELEAQRLASSYKHILNNQSVYIIKTDKLGYFQYANDYYFKTFGRDAVLNRANALNSITDEGQEKARQIAIKALKQPNVPHEIILKKAKGDRIIGSKWEFRAVTNDIGEVEEILCVGYDITSELESLEQAKRYIEVISNQNERLKSFAHIVSHDIRSHSANIISLIEFLKEAQDAEEEEMYMEMLQLSSSKLDQTIKDLNEILSINEEHRKPQKLVNLYDAIEKVRLSLIGSLMKQQVILHNDVDQNIWLDAVPSYVDSILINLISNGVKYSSPVRNSYIKVNTSVEGNKYTISFEDNGLGIDLGLHGDKVFEMYKTFHGNEDSRGFGLYITRNQVEAMGGRISVDSQVDVGSTFKIELFDGVLVK